jgi:hypothetical protein
MNFSIPFFWQKRALSLCFFFIYSYCLIFTFSQFLFGTGKNPFGYENTKTVVGIVQKVFDNVELCGIIRTPLLHNLKNEIQGARVDPPKNVAKMNFRNSTPSNLQQKTAYCLY